MDLVRIVPNYKYWKLGIFIYSLHVQVIEIQAVAADSANFVACDAFNNFRILDLLFHDMQ